MKRLALIFLLLFGAPTAALSAFAIFQTASSGVVNMGGGANMLERSLFATNTPALPFSQWYTSPGSGSPALSTSDYYSTDGLYWGRPYDLDTMGADGATIKAREGARYVWILCGDHPVQENFSASRDFYVAYSNDPQVFPDPGTMWLIRSQSNTQTIVDQNGTTQTNAGMYETPWLVYNPDPGAFAPFYIYAEGAAGGFQHELMLLTTTDLRTGTFRGPAIPTTTFGGWTSFGQPLRLGVNSWEVYTFGKPDGSATSPATYKYTSTDGWVWTSTFSPAADGFGPFLNIAGQASLLSGERGTNDYLAYWAVNSNKQRISGSTRISDAFASDATAAGNFPWQTILQDVQAYEEDGVASIYITRGFPTSFHDKTNKGPFLNNFPTLMTVQGSIVSTGGSNGLLTVSSGPPYPLLPGFRILSQANDPTISTDNGNGTYNLIGTGAISATSGPYTVPRNGGLWHTMVDQYYLITDATAAASAAPLGVKASCAAGVATVQWNNSLPHQNYRIYKGSSAGTQATLVGTISGTSITDTPTANAQTWYKVVTMNVTEQKSRVVNVYCSVQTAQVNKHVNRVFSDGGTFNNLASDITFIASADSYLTTNDYYKYLIHWVDVRMGFKLDGSSFISKVYCLGTTRMPKYGDYTPTTSSTYPSTSSNTSYSATGFRGTTPAWVNNVSGARGYFGNGRGNLIQRKNEITLIAAYQRSSNVGFLAMFGNGPAVGFYLGQAGSASGNITFALSPDWSTTYTTATAAFASGTAPHVAAGIFDGTNITAYLDGVAGTPVSLAAANNPTMEKNTVLRGQFTLTPSNVPVLVSGSQESRFDTNSSEAISYNFPFSQSLSAYAGLIVFEKGLPAAVTGITALYN